MPKCSICGKNFSDNVQEHHLVYEKHYLPLFDFHVCKSCADIFDKKYEKIKFDSKYPFNHLAYDDSFFEVVMLKQKIEKAKGNIIKALDTEYDNRGKMPFHIDGKYTYKDFTRMLAREFDELCDEKFWSMTLNDKDIAEIYKIKDDILNNVSSIYTGFERNRVETLKMYLNQELFTAPINIDDISDDELENLFEDDDEIYKKSKDRKNNKKDTKKEEVEYQNDDNNKILNKSVSNAIDEFNKIQDKKGEIDIDDIISILKNTLTNYRKSLVKEKTSKEVPEEKPEEEHECNHQCHECESNRLPITPKNIKEALDFFVIGQETAKKTIAVGLYNHMMRVNFDLPMKSNILFVGPTGSGKTEIIRALSKIINVPMIIANASGLTQTGYYGRDVTDLLFDLIAAADGDVKQAELGIIYIDEIDKIAKSSGGGDIGGRKVQQELLKIVEGNIIELERKEGMEMIRYTIDTRNILFIAGGAFESLTMENLEEKHIGFNKTTVEIPNKKVNSRDLVKFGMLPELIGRFPVIAQFNKLNTEELKRVLLEPVDSLVNQYKVLFSISDVKLEFTDKSLDWIAKKADESNTGARALTSIIEGKLLDCMYDVPSEENINKVIIDIKDDDLFIKKTKKKPAKKITATVKMPTKNKNH